jgi:HipA-like kinase
VSSPTATAALRTVRATRYVAPLREGGSLPALVEADDDGLYVVKLRGAGQGPKALVAELVAGELARRAGLSVPEIAYVEMDPALAPAEPDQEIQDLLRASVGLNAGLDFLPGALAFDPAAPPQLEPALAAAVVWLDALVVNVDRTARNPNLLEWHGRLWLIDHGAALYHHHRSWALAERARDPFPAIAEHVLLPFACSIDDVDAGLAAALGDGALEDVAALVPDAWLVAEGEDADPAARRRPYVDYLARRLEPPRAFVREAERARRG